MRLPHLKVLLLLAAAVVALSVAAPQLVFQQQPQSTLDEGALTRLLLHLRRELGRTEPAILPPEFRPYAQERAPLIVTMWVNGGRGFSFQSDSRCLTDAYGPLVEELRAYYGPRQRERVRLELVVARSLGSVPDAGPLFSLAFVEGHDGVSGVVDGRRVYAPPLLLVRGARYGSFKPVLAVDAAFGMGLEPAAAARAVCEQAVQLGIIQSERCQGEGAAQAVSAFGRFRALAVVEGEDLLPRPVYKSTVGSRPVTHEVVFASVRAGAGYLERALQPDGKYRYYWDPLQNRNVPEAYNWPRHAGVSYSLALVARLLGDDQALTTARLALSRFKTELGAGPAGSLCLVADGGCYLGSSALGLLALAEYRLASGDSQFDEIARAIAAYLRAMQRPDGFFFHEWSAKKGIDERASRLYASQQAVLALARYSRAQDDQAALSAAIRGMDYLCGPYWDHFLGNFFFLQEHWTCLAAEEVFAAVPKRAYAALCYDIGMYYNRISLGRGDTPFAEDAGGMSVTHFFTPHLGGTATAAEAMVTAVILGRAIGKDTSTLEAQLRTTFGYLMHGQVSAHDGFWIKRPAMAIGGFFDTQGKPRIRIDTVQHAISAMARGLELGFVPRSPVTADEARRLFVLP